MQARKVPVIVGVGQINDLSDASEHPLDVIQLMQAALSGADRDAGGGVLTQLDFLGVENHMSGSVAPWPGTEPFLPHLIEATGLAPKSSLLTPQPSGDGPVLLLNHAANLVASGEIEVAALVGGEALRTAARRSAAETGKAQNAMRQLLDATVRPFLRKYGLTTPTDVYPLYESATRAAWGQSFAEAQRETATMWAAYSSVAAENDGACIREPLTAEQIATVSDRNRMITFPYTKLMVANSAVNQGAAVLVISLERARRMGISEDRIVYVGAGAAASESEDFLARDSYVHSRAMEVSIGKTLELNRLRPDELDYVELYNCFPCVAKMARRALGWPLERAPSVYGGLSFGGGPIGNCMMHAIVMMTRKLRARGNRGFIFANGGFATHNHSIVLSRAPIEDAATLPRDFDFESDAERLRGPAPVLDEEYAGPGRIEAYSVPYGRDGRPSFGTIVARAPDGRRFVCRVPQDDQEGLSFLVSGDVEPVGSSGVCVTSADGYRYWRRMQ
jgi:acetyl-CoA C-acetyltransferase